LGPELTPPKEGAPVVKSKGRPREVKLSELEGGTVE
jgi:hypothetical protein